jgi:NTP pyrophosphatase (non-canonical NTP hydrolase)
MSEFDHIRTRLATFTRERDWDPFHSPKNLVMALSVEIAELMEHFQWLTEQQSSNLGMFNSIVQLDCSARLAFSPAAL